MRIALFGGTFNPIHLGHLIVAEMARCQFNLDRVFFIPSGNPPHKEAYGIASAKDRYQLVAQSIDDNPAFTISPFEMSRGNRYTYQTISYFKKEYPEDELFYIIGEDSLAEMHTWKKGLKLLDMCTFIVFPRQDHFKIPEKIKKNVSWIDMPAINISATSIRKRIAQKKSISYLVPAAAERYIYSKKLYR